MGSTKMPLLLAGIAAVPLLAFGTAHSLDAKPAKPPVTAKTVTAKKKPQEPPVLRRFTSAAEFNRFLDQLDIPSRRQSTAPPAPPVVEASPLANASAKMADAAAEPSAATNPEITNNQTVGVDEGGIIKQIGNYLVVLQDGRVFTVDLGSNGSTMRLADRINVYRNAEKSADWYDEMLVLQDRILVTAYNYSESATEMTVLKMSPTGQLSREGRFLISSNDYYSTDNYATRLIGDQLIFYTPISLYELRGERGRLNWPQLRRAAGDGEATSGKAVVGPTDIYRPIGSSDGSVLHNISVCPLRQTMECKTTAFIGPAMREFYVSPDSAYLWIGAPDGLPWSIDYGNQRRDKNCPVNQYWRDDRAQSAALLYRLPIDGGPVGAAAVTGIPTNQFAFEAKDGRFRALLQQPMNGQCGYAQEPRALALMDIPLSAFTQSVNEIRPGAYTPLPPIDGGELENRFVGNWLVYGGRKSWSSMPEAKQPPQTADAKVQWGIPPGKGLTSSLFAVPLAAPQRPTKLTIPHNAIRIERAGNDALVTGYGYRGPQEGLNLSYVTLGNSPRISSSLKLDRRYESEGRSHAFNATFRPDGSGLIGLPTSIWRDRAGRGWSDSEASDLSFIAVSPDKRLARAGELQPAPKKATTDYVCEKSCVDWYGNSRPIFTRGRIFALLGAELVEGTMRGGTVTETGRVDLTAKPRRGR